jgi:hypothetical protein
MKKNRFKGMALLGLCLVLFPYCGYTQLHTGAWGPNYVQGVLYLGQSGQSDNVVIVGDRQVSKMYLKTANTDRMVIDGTGKIGIGLSAPTRTLHLRKEIPEIFIEGTGASAAGKIDFGYNTNSYYNIRQTLIGAGAYQGSAFIVGPSAGTGKSITFQVTGKIVFSNNTTFGLGAATPYEGISGRYLFDDQVGATKLLIAEPAVGTYPAIPNNYIFSVHGNTNHNGMVQVNNTSNQAPNEAIEGITMANNLTPGATAYSWIQTNTQFPLALNPISPSSNNTSYVAIGFVPGTYTVPVNYKLAVKGKIICEELKVKYAGQWSDYVFEDNYKLLKLSEVEKFILDNKHLPSVPSAKEIENNGFELGEMDATLLKKIEELTLYLIEQDKLMQKMARRIEVLENESMGSK